jgi:hypothetical protein
MKTWEIGAVGAGVVLAAGVAYAATRHHAAPCDPAMIQQRPFPDSPSSDQLSQINAVAGYQLTCLGYGSDAASGQRFGSDHSASVRAYTGTDPSSVTLTQLLLDAAKAADDIYRVRVGAPRASDYVAPSSGLFSPTRFAG